MIPKTIHYIWLGKAELPDMAKTCINTCKVHNPGYEIIVWNESSLSDLFKVPFFKRAMNEKMWAFASDYARLWVLNKYGGIYLDTDVEVIKPLDNLLSDSFFIGMENIERIGTAVIGSCENNEVVRLLLKEYEDYKYGKAYIPNPELLSPLIIGNKMAKIYSYEFFYPYNPYRVGSEKQLMVCNLTNNTYAIHHWGKTWGGNWKYYIRRIPSKIKKAFKSVVKNKH